MTHALSATGTLLGKETQVGTTRPMFLGVYVALVASLVLFACGSSQPHQTALGVNSATSEPAEGSALPTSTTPSNQVAFLDLDLDGKISRFLEAPNSTLAANIASEMGQTGDPRWTPWLIDVLKLGFSSETTWTATRALADLSGLSSTGNAADDFVKYGSWVRDQQFDLGPEYREWKLAFLGALDPSYPTLVKDIESLELLSYIQWGGVRRGGIPELNNPEHVNANAAHFLQPDELVIGAVINTTPIAYPLRFINHHELLNDVVDDVPITLGYCSLCRTGIVYLTELPEDVLKFQTSGLLIDSNKIMVDNNTDSLWRHIHGDAIAGPKSGTTLTAAPSVTTTWSSWVEKHPTSLTISTPDTTWFPGQPERQPITYDYTPSSAYQRYYSEEDLWFPAPTAPTTALGLKDEVVGIALEDLELAIPVEDLGSVPFVVNTSESTLLILPTGAGARVYKSSEVPTPDLLDLDTIGTQWTETHVAVPLQHTPQQTVLFERVPSTQMFWFAWHALHPDTRIQEKSPTHERNNPR